MMHKFMELLSMKESFYLPGILAAVCVVWVYKKRGLIFLVTGILIVALNDFLSHSILKELVARPRPCHALPELAELLHCSNSYSFPSNHASNIFTMATYVTLCYRSTSLLAFTIAFLVGYSRIYLGFHYPLDVFGGALVGTLMGLLGYKCFQKLTMPVPAQA